MLAKRLSGNMRPETLARFALPVNLALIVVLANSLARLTWTLMPPPPMTASAPLSSARAPSDTATSHSTDYAAIADWHLFGKVNAYRPVIPTPVKAPETQLDLKLVGIFHADNSGKALAIIAKGGGKESIFRVGEEVSRGVTLIEIHPDQIVLARNGHPEALSLPKQSPGFPRRQASSDGQTDEATPTQRVDATEIAGRFRDVLRDRPQALEELAFVSPYLEGGEFRGVSLRPGKNRKLLGELGLRSGDVIVEINGSALESPSQAFTLLGGMFNDNQANLLVLRKGKPIPFTFSLTGQ